MIIWRHALACAAMGMAAAAWAEMRVVGSDLLAADLGPALQAWARAEERKITVTMTGSHDAWRALEAGQADLALLSFGPDTPARDDTWVVLPFARHVSAIYVPAALPLEQADLSRLAGVFGQSEGGAWKRWSDLGVTGIMASRPMQPVVIRPDGSLGAALFRHLVLRGQPWRNDLPMQPIALPSDAVSLPDDSIILAPLPWSPPAGYRVLALARETDTTACLPEARALERGDYPLAWPVHIVFRRTHVGALYPLVRHLLGEDIARLGRRMFLMPPSDAVRNEALFSLEQLEK